MMIKVKVLGDEVYHQGKLPENPVILGFEVGNRVKVVETGNEAKDEYNRPLIGKTGTISRIAKGWFEGPVKAVVQLDNPPNNHAPYYWFSFSELEKIEG